MRESIDASEAARDLLPHVAQTNPPPWFHILEELLNLADNYDAAKMRKPAHKQT
jgi:hypothetical protein